MDKIIDLAVGIQCCESAIQFGYQLIGSCNPDPDLEHKMRDAIAVKEKELAKLNSRLAKAMPSSI